MYIHYFSYHSVLIYVTANLLLYVGDPSYFRDRLRALQKKYGNLQTKEVMKKSAKTHSFGRVLVFRGVLYKYQI